MHTINVCYEVRILNVQKEYKCHCPVIKPISISGGHNLIEEIVDCPESI